MFLKASPIVWLLCFLLRCGGGDSDFFQETDSKSIKLVGDVMIGGLFPMHEKGRGKMICGDIKVQKGIQRVEAMLYAIDKINSDSNLLPNITLGVHILDTCLQDTYALEQSLEFIKAQMSTMDFAGYRCKGGDRVDYTPNKPVAGVIGAAASPVSIMVANILRLFKIPQISYASTGIELSDKSRFSYFSRVVPPDTYQAQAMIDIVKAFGWTYVTTVADEGNYGERGISAFEDLAQKSGVCIARSLKIARQTRHDTFERIIKELEQNSRSKVVVLFVNEDNCRRLVSASVARNKTDDFYWLASDSWGAKVVPVLQQEWAAEGAITILPQRKVLKDFDTYFTQLTPSTNKRNPWFWEYWQAQFHCSSHNANSYNRPCTGREQLRNYSQEGLVPYVVDAVYTMAYALDKLQQQKCGKRGHICDAMLPLAGPELLKMIRNVSFRGATGHMINFNKNGDARGRYTIYQFQSQPNKPHSYVRIGTWSDSNLHLVRSRIRWKGGELRLPTSVCSFPCPSGHYKNSQDLDDCCWVCIPCADHEYLANEHTCIACANGSYPDSNHTTCEPLPIQYMTFDHPWSIVLVVMATSGILLVVFVFAVFVRFNKTPVIMASGRELCFVLQFGLLCCYTMTFVIVAKPSIVSCVVMRTGLGLSLAVCYAAIFIKTNRISRIFNRGVRAMVKRPSYTSPRSQLVICASLVSIQLVIAVTWLGIDLPDTTLVFPDRRTVILQCKSSNVAIILSLLYNMILIVMCTVYAFKTRGIPANFNETKYIAFTMYSTCIVWLAFVPIYFGTNKADFKIQITALCVCVSISATIVVVCLFGPKVYLVLFQPHKNVRQSSKCMFKPQMPLAAGSNFFKRKNDSKHSLNGVLGTPATVVLLTSKGAHTDSERTEVQLMTNLDSDLIDTSEAEPEMELQQIADKQIETDKQNITPEITL